MIQVCTCSCLVYHSSAKTSCHIFFDSLSKRMRASFLVKDLLIKFLLSLFRAVLTSLYFLRAREYHFLIPHVNIFQISLSVLGNKKLVNVFQEQHKELELKIRRTERAKKN